MLSIASEKAYKNTQVTTIEIKATGNVSITNLRILQKTLTDISAAANVTLDSNTVSQIN
jgi:hypothetical protein